MKDALSYQVRQLLLENKLFIDFDELAFQIQSHPTYPSLHAVTGVLDHFNIKNLALDVPVNSNTLDQLPRTFLAQLEIDSQKQFAIVTKSKDNWKIVFNSKDKNIVSQHEFLEQFTGIILAVEKDSTNINTQNTGVNFSLIKILSYSGFALFGLLFFVSNSNISNISFMLLSLVGIYIATVILKQEQGESTVLGDAFCSNPTEKKNCNAVLSSKAATIYKDLKLSDLSLIYFTGLALASFLLTISNHAIFITKLISVLALPAIIYSIYYQSVVIKKWCFLCLSIVAVMCCQAGIAMVFFQSTYNLESILIVMLSFSFITAFWLFESKLLKNVKSLQKVKIDYFKFKRNFELFYTQLDKSKTINIQIEDKQEIVFGNKNSAFNLTIITNPLCGHCKPIHNLIEQILNNHEQSTKLTVRFNVNPNNLEDKAVQITSRLLEIYNVDGSTICLKAMHDIYGNLSIDEWYKKWKFCSEPQKYLPILKDEFAWCNENAINFTPEILINGKSYPRTYDRTDLIYFIEDLEEQSQIGNTNPKFLIVKEA